MGGKQMIKTIKTLIAVAALSGTVGANVHAAKVTVDKGDTLWNISKVHNASVENIKNWNKLSTDLIHPGDVLTIPQEKHYTVKNGDTLWDIALDNNVTVDQINKWNKLTTELIKPGLNLVFYENTAPVKTKMEKQVKTVINTPISKPSIVKPNLPIVKKNVKPKKALTSVIKAKVKAASVKKSGKKVIKVKATAYTASCTGCSGVTRTGVNLKSNPNSKVISVDPKVIPLGSKVYVEGYGYATAADTGGAIKGNRIDIFIASHNDAINFGAKQLKVTIIN
jgi:3D (Asp-Asp-Asp) domain-containing protein/LysM repeat protein